jgi:hypothetical protein
MWRRIFSFRFTKPFDRNSAAISSRVVPSVDIVEEAAYRAIRWKTERQPMANLGPTLIDAIIDAYVARMGSRRFIQSAGSEKSQSPQQFGSRQLKRRLVED